MKMTKKKVFVVSLVVCAIAILSMGTLAWFNATDEVTNKFMVADSNQDGAPDFSIEVKETENDGDDTVDADDDGDTKYTTKGNTYDKIAPGDLIAKDPIITNTGDYNQWVRVNILISKDFADQVAEAQGIDIPADEAPALNMPALLHGFNTDAYSPNESSATAYTDYYLYAYYLKTQLEPNDSITVFTQVEIPSVFTQEDMNYGTDGFQIIVRAEAIQSDNIDTTADEAFAIAGWKIGTAYGA